MTMAFQASPHLAFNVYLRYVLQSSCDLVIQLLSYKLFYSRFKTIEAVTKELNRLIQTNPVAFIDIPEASQVNG